MQLTLETFAGELLKAIPTRPRVCLVLIDDNTFSNRCKRPACIFPLCLRSMFSVHLLVKHGLTERKVAPLVLISLDRYPTRRHLCSKYLSSGERLAFPTSQVPGESFIREGSWGGRRGNLLPGYALPLHQLILPSGRFMSDVRRVSYSVAIALGELLRSSKGVTL